MMTHSPHQLNRIAHSLSRTAATQSSMTWNRQIDALKEQYLSHVASEVVLQVSSMRGKAQHRLSRSSKVVHIMGVLRGESFTVEASWSLRKEKLDIEISISGERSVYHDVELLSMSPNDTANQILSYLEASLIGR